MLQKVRELLLREHSHMTSDFWVGRYTANVFSVKSVGNPRVARSQDISLSHLLLRLFVLKGVSSKPSGKMILGPDFCFSS